MLQPIPFKPALLFSTLFLFQLLGMHQTGKAQFPLPDSACGGIPVTLTNPAPGASGYYWNFCNTAISTTPGAVNLGSFGGAVSIPTWISIAKDGNDYYAFTANHLDGTIIRLSFGSSLGNTPVAFNMGRLGNALPTLLESIKIINDNGVWYGLAVGGNAAAGVASARVVVINFGASLANNTPVATNLGNFLAMGFPTDIKVLKEAGNWAAFITDAYSNSRIVRLDFGNALSNAPLATAINVPNMSFPTGMCEVKDRGNWYLFVCNNDNSTLTRISLGASLFNNTPASQNLGNPGNLLYKTRDMMLLRTCEGLHGYVFSESNKITGVRFAGDSVMGAMTATDMGNPGNQFSFPHSASELLRSGDTLYSLVANVNNNSILRLAFGSCVAGSGVAAAHDSTPSVIFPNVSGIVPVNLLIDEGLPTQRALCGSIYITQTPAIDSVLVHEPLTCDGREGSLTIFTSLANTDCIFKYTKDGIPQNPVNLRTGGRGEIVIINLEAGVYENITVTYGKCVSPPAGPYILKGPLSPRFVIEHIPAGPLCEGDTVVLYALGLFENPSYLWSTGDTTTSVRVNSSGTYMLMLTDGICSGADTAEIIFRPLPEFDLGNDTTICDNRPLTIGGIPYTQAQGATWQWNTADYDETISVSATGRYILEVDLNGCTAADTINITALAAPEVLLPPDGDICEDATIVLDAGNYGSAYRWSTGDTTQTISVTAAGRYDVHVSRSGCWDTGSVHFRFYPKPTVILPPDTVVCEEQPLVLEPLLLNADILLWPDGSTRASWSTISEGIYTLSAQNKCGIVYDTITVGKIHCDVWVPGAFTPNGDGRNDEFRVLGNTGRLERFGLSIYNRWGERIFHSSDKRQGWDGSVHNKTNAPVGTYMYMLEYSIGDREFLHKGTVHLIR